MQGTADFTRRERWFSSAAASAGESGDQRQPRAQASPRCTTLAEYNKQLRVLRNNKRRYVSPCWLVGVGSWTTDCLRAPLQGCRSLAGPPSRRCVAPSPGAACLEVSSSDAQPRPRGRCCFDPLPFSAPEISVPLRQTALRRGRRHARSPAFPQQGLTGHGGVAHTAAFRGYMHCMGLLEEMTLDGLRPDEEAYISVIMAAMRGKQMQHAQYFFREMCTSGIKPTVRAYACATARRDGVESS